MSAKIPNSLEGVGTDPFLDSAHVERGLDALLPPYNADDDTVYLIEFVLEEIQRVENYFYSLIVDRIFDPEHVSGVWLDRWGEIVGVPRAGRTREHYSRVVAARILANRSEGLVSQITQALATVAGAESTLYQLTAPMEYYVYYTVQAYLSASERADVVDIIRYMTRATVGVSIVEAKAAGYFGFDDDPEALGFNLGEWAERVDV